MFKIIATDLDGTLLRQDGSVSEYTQKILAEAAQKGVETIICTGRMFTALRGVLPQVPFCRYAITIMGAEIYDIKEKKKIFSMPLEDENVEFLLQYGYENNLHTHIYIDDVLYVNAMDKYTEYYTKHSTSIANLLKEDMRQFAKGKKLSKILFMAEADEVKVHLARLKKLKGEKINFCASDPTYLECSSIKAQKDITLNYFIEQLGIKRDELIVFGDSGNDISMLKNTGFSCAMANGWPEAKEVADLVVESNEEDGVAKTVERLILNGE